MEENVDSIIAKYGQRTPKKPRKGRIVIISALILLVSAGIAVGALLVVKNKTAQAPNVPTAQTTGGPSPKEVIDKIATNDTITGSKNYVLYRLNSPQSTTSTDTTTVIFKQNGYNFLTNATASDGLQFTRVDAKLASNKTAMTDAVKSVLTSAGFTEVTQDTASLSAYATTSYSNGGTVCQITDFVTTKQTTSEQGVLCISSADLVASYNNVKTLLDTADPAIAASAKTVNQSTITSGTKKLLTLTVLPNNSKETTNYYFATLDKDYAYIGSRATPSVDNQASYSLSDTLKKNISDPKWGAFLTDNIK